MDWMIEIVAAVLLTSLTGGTLLLVWYVVGWILDCIGYMNILYDMLRVNGLFFYIPLAYLVISVADRGISAFGGSLFWQTPKILSHSYWAFAVWIFGAICVAGHQLIVELYAKHQFRDAASCQIGIQRCLEQVCGDLNIEEQSVEVRSSYKVSSPCILGGRKKQIVLPEECYDDEKLRMIFLHELTHDKQKHLRYNGMAIVISCIHWFNPMAWWFRTLVTRWCEYDCDARVSKKVNVKAYITLLKEVGSKEGVILGNKVALFQTKSELLRRIERMYKYSKMKKRSKLLALIVCVLMLLTNTVTVCAASTGVANAYQNMYGETVVKIEENLQEQNVLVEYEIPGFPEGAIIEDGEVRSGARGSAMFLDWGVGTNVYK